MDKTYSRISVLELRPGHCGRSIYYSRKGDWVQAELSFYRPKDLGCLLYVKDKHGTITRCKVAYNDAIMILDE